MQIHPISLKAKANKEIQTDLAARKLIFKLCSRKTKMRKIDKSIKESHLNTTESYYLKQIYFARNKD